MSSKNMTIAKAPMTSRQPGHQSPAVMVHMPFGALVVPNPTVAVMGSVLTWPSWNR
jgi:hypothetical protein